MTEENRKALKAFVTKAQSHFGTCLLDILLFEERKRWDDLPHSDVQLAMIFTNKDFESEPEQQFLSDLSYDSLIDGGVGIEVSSFVETDWIKASAKDRVFIETVKQAAVSLMVAA